MPKRIYRKYSAELKQKVVEGYLSGKGSLRELAKKHQIGDKSRIIEWIQCYNGHKEFRQPSAARGALYMTKGKKTTQKERAEIVAFCLKHGKDYLLTVEQFGVSYQQIYTFRKIIKRETYRYRYSDRILSKFRSWLSEQQNDNDFAQMCDRFCVDYNRKFYTASFEELLEYLITEK